MLGAEHDNIPICILIDKDDKFVAAYYYNDDAISRAKKGDKIRVFEARTDGSKLTRQIYPK